MPIKDLELTNARSFARARCEFSSGINLLIGACRTNPRKTLESQNQMWYDRARGVERDANVAYNFIPCDRDQTFLMPPSLLDWVGEDHLAWFVVDAVSQMDLSAFYAKYRSDGSGAAAFTPDMMVSLLLYAYCVGERSSRKIEKLCETDVAFKIVAANRKPDHATIARFRRKNLKELEGLFTPSAAEFT